MTDGETDGDSPDENPPPRDDDHLAEVPDGSGCTEIWEHLAERRREEEASADD